MSLLPAPGAQGPVQADDPLDALSTLLSGSSPTAAAPSLSSPNRNQALSSAIAGKYGIPGAADGSVSQTDLEAMDSFMRGGALNDKIAAEVAPVQAQGEYGLKNRELQNQGALDTENLKGQYGLQGQALKNQGLEAIAGAKAHASAADPDVIDSWARQVAADRGALTQVPMAIRSQVVERATQGGNILQPITNQTRQMGETASALLDQMPSVLDLGEKLNQAGLFHPGIGTVRSFLAKHGANTLAGVDPTTAADIGDFETQMGLMQSGMARAHAGARGAGNSEIAKRFEQLMSQAGDYPSFLGSMRGAAGFLGRYRDALHAGANPDNPNDPLLRQLDQQLHMESGTASGADLGADWGGR